MALLEEYVTVEVGFEVTYARSMPKVAHPLPLVKMWNFQLLPQHHVCPQASMLPITMRVD